VLGQDVGAVGNPAVLLSNREIPMNGNSFTLGVAGDRHFIVDPATRHYVLGSIDAAADFVEMLTLPFFVYRIVNEAGSPLIFLGDTVANPSSQMSSPNVIFQLLMDESVNQITLGDAGATCLIGVDLGGNQIKCVATNGFKITGNTTLMHTGTTLSNNAGVAVGTLNNSPSAGNPTKWIVIDDNGTPRKIPTWL
jgi:hypothetical protein